MKPVFASLLIALSLVPLSHGQRFLDEAKPPKPPVGKYFKAYTPKKDAEPSPVPPERKKPVVAAQTLPKEVVRERPLERLSLRDAISLAARHADASSRFLWLGDIGSASELANWTVLLVGHLNHLSVESDSIGFAIVPGSNGQLFRIDVNSFGTPFAESWEKLGEQEPIFHVRLLTQTIDIETPWKGGIWPADGKFYAAKSFNVWTQKKVNKVALAPWLSGNQESKNAISQLFSATQSQTPIVSAQWFIYQSGAQKNRSPGYYQFIGLKNAADIDKLSGFDKKLMTVAKRKELLEAVAESGVSHQPRRIASFPTIGTMRKWVTFDSNLALDKNNPLRILDDDNFSFNASETFFSLPNGLWGFALSDAEGKLQDNVPDNVGVGPDTTSTNNDGRIHVCASCVRCHLPFDGLQPIDGWARNLYKPPLTLRAVTPEIERDLRSKYLRDLQSPLEDDRRSYARTLKQLIGITPKEYADLFSSFWAQYEAPVTVERAAREIGVSEAVFRQSLLSYLKATPIADSVISSFLRIGRVPRYQWLEIYNTTQEVVARFREK